MKTAVFGEAPPFNIRCARQQPMACLDLHLNLNTIFERFNAAHLTGFKSSVDLLQYISVVPGKFLQLNSKNIVL